MRMLRNVFLSMTILVVAAGATASAALTNVIVVPANIGIDWFNTAPVADTRTGGSATLVNGPSTPPLGTGSLQMTSDSAIAGSGQAKAQFVTGLYIGTPLSSIDELGYWAYRSSASTNPAAQVISLNIAVDYIGDGTSFTTLVFEPVYNPTQGAIQTDTWQKWDAFGSGNAVWWSTRSIPGVCAFDCFVPWSTILANNPNAKIVGIVGFNIGSGWVGQFTGAVDALAIGVSGDTKVFDFEAELPDADGDGVPDASDLCPNSSAGSTIVIDGCDTGVPDTLSPSGCKVSDLIAQCAAGAKNHGQFTSCVSALSNELKNGGLISGAQKGAIQSCAAKANLP